MKQFDITSKQDNKILFTGRFRSFQECIVQAVADNVKLCGANLSYKNLTNITLDGTDLAHADFSGSNLTGANMSEANLQGANLKDTDLYNTCFALSDLRRCNFEGASFGATDIAGCDISGSSFSTLSCFTLDFMLARTMKDCVFINPDGWRAFMSRPPVVIRGATDRLVVLMDECIKVGHDMMPYPARSKIPATLTAGAG